jgi:hypothetical protein
MSPRILRTAIFTLCALFSGLLCAADDTPGFRRFANTISPDGAYVLAWGWGGGERPQKLKEWPSGRDTAEEQMANFLVDAAGGKVLAEIPEHDHFVTSAGRWKQFGGLAANWSEDSQRALAIYGGRWSDDSILWIDPKKRTFTEVLGPLETATREFLTKKEKINDLDDEDGVTFNRPALLPGGVLVMDVCAKPKVNQPESYDYRLKFMVKFDGKKPACTLVGGRKIPQPPEDARPEEVQAEEELNKAYQELRAKSKDAERAALRDRQLQWLKQREALAESERSFFTRMRAAWLRARAEN